MTHLNKRRLGIVDINRNRWLKMNKIESKCVRCDYEDVLEF